jgi:signal peptidase I
VNKFVYGRLEVPLTQTALVQLPGLRAPRVGDVIVFIYPKERDKDFVKRIVAVAGQTVEVHGTTLTVDGVAIDDPHAHYVKPQHLDYGPFTVPPDHVFVMGDNRDESYDSRFWGPVPVGDIKGLAMVIYWSWGEGGSVRWDRIGRTID